MRYAHFGSPFLFSDVFWGPDSTRAVIEPLEKGEWLDDVYGEAGIALCYRTRKAALYTYQLSPDDTSTALRLMKPLWPGWELRFGTKLSDVITTLGVDVAAKAIRAIQKRAPKIRAQALTRNPLANLGQRFRAEGFEGSFGFQGLVSVVEDGRTGDRTVDRLLDVSPGDALHAGPALLDALPRAPTLDEAGRVIRRLHRSWDTMTREGLLLRPDAHAHIDVARRELVVTVEPGLTELEHFVAAHAFEGAWPEWTVRVQRGGLAAHFALTARAVPAVMLPSSSRAPAPPASDDAATSRDDRVVDSLRHIHGLLFSADARKEEGGAFLERVSGDLGVPVDPEGIPDTRLPLEERRRLWARAVEEAGLSREVERALRERPPEEPEQPPVVDVELNLFSAQSRWREKRYADARAGVEELMALRPRDARLHALAGRVAFSMERLDDARTHSEAALVLDAENEDAWATLALVAGTRGDFDERVRCWERAIEAAPVSWIVNNLAVAYLERAGAEADPARRRGLLERALATTSASPSRAPMLLWSAACALSLMEERADEAQALLEEALAKTWAGERASLRKRMLADPELQWLWRQGRTLSS